MEQNTLVAPRYQSRPSTIRHNTDSSLKGYLKEVSFLEVQAYNQNRLISKLTVKAKQLGKNSNISKPQKPSFSLHNLLDTKNLFCIIPASIAISFLIVTAFAGLIYVGILGFVVFMCLAMIPDCLTYRSDMKRYSEDMKKYNASIAADARRVKHELTVKAEVEQQIKYITLELEKTLHVLDSIYALNILHPSYRNLVAVCSFYDYLDKGICTKLTEHGGAYAFYEEELRFRRIETRLDVIINKLDEIISNQQQLASLLKEGNAAINKIVQQNNYMASTLDDIRENTAVTAYNTHCAAQSTAIMESIAIYRTLKYD